MKMTVEGISLAKDGEGYRATDELIAIIARTKNGREHAKPTHHIRERLAAAIHASHPTFMLFPPDSAYQRFLWQPEDRRELYEKWADEFLRCCDVLQIEIIDTREA